MGAGHFSRGRTPQDDGGFQESHLNRRRELARFLKFTVVGAIGTVVDFGTFNLLRGVVGVPAAFAQAISFSAAVVSNFLWNRYWTYSDSRSKPVGRQAFQFIMVSLIGLAIRTGVFVLVQPTMIALSKGLLPGEASSIAVGENLALVVAVLVVLFWNFGINRVWTYSDVQ